MGTNTDRAGMGRVGYGVLGTVEKRKVDRLRDRT